MEQEWNKSTSSDKTQKQTRISPGKGAHPRIVLPCGTSMTRVEPPTAGDEATKVLAQAPQWVVCPTLTLSVPGQEYQLGTLGSPPGAFA
eukprot:9397037-Pyramimonas_sp.AAC.1